MTEADLNGKARDRIIARCPRVWIKKLNDNATKGLPDTILTWGGPTTALEFKHLNPSEPVHAKVGSTRGLKRLQLMELLRFEEQSQGRAWVVVYRKGKGKCGPTTEIYRPAAMVTATTGTVITITPQIASEPTPHENVLRDLRTRGVAWFNGYDHDALVELIFQTHVGY